jgi:uncharacterized membrane protein
MSQQDNFSGGFILGAIVGGVVGGIFGVALATAKTASTTTAADDAKVARPRRRPLRVPTSESPVTEQSMEVARQGLEDRIAQLNDAIDDVRLQLGSVNGKSDVTADKL